MTTSRRLTPAGVPVRAALLLAALLSAGCATTRQGEAPAPERELAGHYESGPQASWFRPCGAPAGEPTMWVTFTGKAVQQADEARATGRMPAGEPTFLRVRAAVTTDGRVGPRGPGFPALLVREVLEARPAGAADCSTGGAS